MRIGIDARYVYDHFPGIGRYVVGLVRGLAGLEHGHTLVLLHNPALPNTRHDLAALAALPHVEPATTAARPFTPGEQIGIPRLARTLRLDLLHSPYYVLPYFGLPCPSIVTIHDLIGHKFPQTLSPRGRRLYRLLMGLAVRSADHLITVSNSSRDDLTRAYGLAPGRVSVTAEAVEGRFSPQPPEAIAAVRARYRLPQRYVLYLGSNKPHKNLERLILAWEQVTAAEMRAPAPADSTAKLQLIIAGHEDQKFPQARQLAAERGLSGSIVFLPNIADDNLPALYSGAEVFVFPSYYEGFGLPPLEAMACGAPVLCANTSSLPEVVGAAALMVDPYRTAEIAAGLCRLLADSGLRDRLRAAGLRHARSFTWRSTARATLSVYERFLRVRG